jgi:molecular chaperone GrpE
VSERRAGGSEEEPPVVIRDNRKVNPHGDTPLRPGPDAQSGEAGGTGPTAGSGAGAGPSEAEQQLAERTADLQRLQAEYANYRKRVDRDRQLVGEVATARVLEALLPVLDDIDRADQHGDLTGAFKAVADHLNVTLERLGLASFGDPGDPFDPTIHEAVMHDESPDVEVPTTTTIMRRGYRVGERLIRAAMVGVSDPANVTGAERDPADDAPEPAADDNQ